jgi:hypothetical protein
MDNHYKELIWTTHAWATWNRPDQSRKGAAAGSWIYYRTYGSERIEVVAKQNEKKEWIVLSVWSRPVVQKASNLPKFSFWNNLLRSIFK